MHSITRHQRQSELVALQLYDKTGLAATYCRVFKLPIDADLNGMHEGEMVRAILDREFPPSQRLAPSVGPWSIAGHAHFA
jgi:hypothetical protein